MDEPIIRARALTKSYHKHAEAILALTGVSLDVRRGDFVGLTGPSGSGKSTLMHLLGCLDVPDSGEYWLDGALVSTLLAHELSVIRNTKLGFVFQSYHLLPQLNAVDNVAMPLLLRGVKFAERREAALEMLARVGLSDRGNHLPHELSGGQRQRVAVARALAARPVLLLADEPTGNLDTTSAATILDLFEVINDEGTTIVVVTHSNEVAVRCHSRFVVEAGCIRCG